MGIVLACDYFLPLFALKKNEAKRCLFQVYNPLLCELRERYRYENIFFLFHASNDYVLLIENSSLKFCLLYLLFLNRSQDSGMTTYHNRRNAFLRRKVSAVIRQKASKDDIIVFFTSLQSFNFSARWNFTQWLLVSTSWSQLRFIAYFRHLRKSKDIPSAVTRKIKRF